MRTLTFFVAAVTVALAGCSEPAEKTPFEDGCVAPPRPPQGHTVELEPVFDDVHIGGSVDMVQAPGDAQHFYIIARSGTVSRFSVTGDPDLSVVLDISERVTDETGEAGLLGIAFHPRFEDNGFVYLSYTTPGPGAFTSRVSRFESTDGGRTLAPDSESIVLEVRQPASNHNGGDIDFGPDGLLYIAFGDGGGSGDSYRNGQNTDTLLGAILRIDVDSAEPYAQVPDNPFAGGGGAPEIFAWGLRNPWRMSFDTDGGQLWAGDVGQFLWEEVNLIERGRNYGWNQREGAHCFERDTCDLEEAVDPVAEYRNPDNASVVGGHVYRGEAIANLAGHFVYSDFYLGTVWAVRPGEQPRVLHESGGRNVSAWAVDGDGTLYAIELGGRIRRMVASSPERDRFPSQLSGTDCVNMDDPASPAAGLIAYDVNVPLWSDGATKERFMSLPGGGLIDVRPDGDWDLPVGSVLVKNFRIGAQLVETRLWMNHEEGGWAGYSYAWEGEDAVLLSEGKTVDVDGQRWTFPSRAQCRYCHTDAAGGSLGLETGQVPDAVVETLVMAGALERAPAGSPFMPLASDAPVEDRARAYLHVNCSMCHRPDAPSGRAELDLRFGTPIDDTGLLDRAPMADWTGPASQQLLTPGDPDNSILMLRMDSTGDERMPSLATNVVDAAAVDVIREWIGALDAAN